MFSFDSFYSFSAIKKMFKNVYKYLFVINFVLVILLHQAKLNENEKCLEN